MKSIRSISLSPSWEKFDSREWDVLPKMGMRYRILGRTGLKISEIGFGAWGIGKTWWGETDDRQSVQALCRSFELGVTFIDTAYGYGDGHSEQLIAQSFREFGKKQTVATKVPLKSPEWPPKPGTPAGVAYPKAWIIDHTERSLKNLELETIDLQQLHIWRSEWLEEKEWGEAIETLKTQGKIRFFGVSLMDHDPDSGLDLVRSGLVDSIQVIYNIFDQTPEHHLLPLCQERGVGVLARVPLDEGGLSGNLLPDTKFNPGSFQARYFRGKRLGETYARAEKLKEFLGPDLKTLPELALRFCLSHEAVSTVIPGMRRSSHVEQNCVLSDGKPFSSDLRRTLKSHAWNRNFYR